MLGRGAGIRVTIVGGGGSVILFGSDFSLCLNNLLGHCWFVYVGWYTLYGPIDLDMQLRDVNTQ